MITVCGENTTLEEIRGIKPTRPPNAGGRWRPIQHGELVDTILDEVRCRGWRAKNLRLATARDGADMAGAVQLAIPHGPAIPDGTSLALGWLHSNARRFALRLTIGMDVMCCCNGITTGNIVLRRTHDGAVQLVDDVEAAVARYREAANAIPDTVAGLRTAIISPPDVSEILCKAGRLGLVGWTTVGRVDKEYRNPTFEEHGHGTAWALLNAFTYAARPYIAATRQMDVYNRFRELLPRYAVMAA